MLENNEFVKKVADSAGNKLLDTDESSDTDIYLL
jgi:hypothetical protein